jgi:hypothetical protein
MLVQEPCDLLGLVSREVVQDDVDVPFGLGLADHLPQKADEYRDVGAPVSMPARGRPRNHLLP